MLQDQKTINSTTTTTIHKLGLGQVKSLPKTSLTISRPENKNQTETFLVLSVVFHSTTFLIKARKRA